MCDLPAVVTLAALDPRLTWHVLSPVGTLVGLHLLAHRLLEVLVRDHPVTICVEVVKKLTELAIVGCHSPVSEIEAEITGNNVSVFAYIHLHECFAHGLPLVVDLSHHFFYQVVVVSLFALVQVFLWVLDALALLMCVKLGVDALGVVTEVETLRFVDSAAEPL